MITILKLKKPTSVYQFSYLKDGIKLISKKGYFSYSSDYYWNDDPIKLKFKALYSEKIKELPGDMGFFIDEIIQNSLFTISGFLSYNSTLRLNISAYDFDSNWSASLYNPKKIIEELKEILSEDFTYSEKESGHYSFDIVYERHASNYATIGEFAEDGIQALKRYQNLIELRLAGFTWKDVYVKDEALFCRDVVFKLLSGMGFNKIFYSHGSSEYGRDFIFSNLDKFGNYVHYGAQVKAGNVDGKVGGKIDELIAQIDDAFKMPFFRENETESYISCFYIIISGKFTNNARQKLRNKIPKHLNGSIFLIDRDRVIELLSNY